MNCTEEKEKETEEELFTRLRKEFRDKNPGPHEDDWLDDEQWYCENAAEWGEPIHVPEEIFRDPSGLVHFLKSLCPEKKT